MTLATIETHEKYEPTAEERRRAADEIRGEILDLLKVIGGLFGDEVGRAYGKELPRGSWLDRLLWLLGLSDAERSFVEAAAEAVTGGKYGDAYETFLVYADWLEDAGRGRFGETIRRLAPAAGEVLVFQVAPTLYKNVPEYREAADECAHRIDESLRRAGRECFVTLGVAGTEIDTLSAEKMESLGWVRLSETLSFGLAFLSPEMTGEPEDRGLRKPDPRSVKEMIRRLKRENAELRQAARLEREACAAAADEISCNYVDGDPRALGAADVVYAIRARPPV